MRRIKPSGLYAAAIPAILFVGMAPRAPAAEITGASEIAVGDILVLTAEIAPGARHRWVIPGDLEPTIQTAGQIALILTQPGPLEILLVEVTTTSINVARFQCVVTGRRSSTPPARAIIQPARPPPAELPLIVMYSRTSPPCPPCEKWMTEQHDKLLGTGWRFSQVKDSPTIGVFPSFEITAGGQTRYFEGYLTADRITEEINEMEASR